MTHFWEIYENLEERVYVSNVQTKEIVYMNKLQRETFGYHETDYIGKKCYEVLHGGRKDCSFCNGSQLKPGEFIQWEFYNPLIEKYFRILNRLVEEDGIAYRLEMMLDITSAKQTAEKLEQTRKLEGIANAGMRAGLKDDNPEHGINNVLAYIGEVLSAERAYIFEKNEHDGNDNTYEWCAEGIVPQMTYLQNVPLEVSRQWYDTFDREKVVVIHDLEEIKESDPLMYEVLLPQGIHSLIAVPLIDGDDVIGFYGIDNPPIEKLSINYEVLEILSTFTVLLLRKRTLYRQLHQQSRVDFLTGAGNRLALYDYLKQLKGTHHIGVLYCDLTGLKEVNDQKGHLEGDRLLKATISGMKQFFSDHQIFRIGGDEFIIIDALESLETLAEKRLQLQYYLKDQNINIAIGENWSEEYPQDLDSFFKTAEQEMYLEKKKWYEAYGIERRCHVNYQKTTS